MPEDYLRKDHTNEVPDTHNNPAIIYELNPAHFEAEESEEEPVYSA